MTAPLDMNDMQRPRRRFSWIPVLFQCPWEGCKARDEETVRITERLADLAAHMKEHGRVPEPGELPKSDNAVDAGLRVVAYRRGSIRLECPGCGVRFSVSPEPVADAMEASPYLKYPHHAEALRDLDSWNKAMRPRRRFKT